MRQYIEIWQGTSAKDIAASRPDNASLLSIVNNRTLQPEIETQISRITPQLFTLRYSLVNCFSYLCHPKKTSEA
jgi:hypothetical protein